jgi:Flp pilus assembly pilin Flp
MIKDTGKEEQSMQLHKSLWNRGRNVCSEFGPLCRQFGNDERGQDLVEYTLLLAFVCLASAALFINAGQSISSIWTVANATASNAAVAAS